MSYLEAWPKHTALSFRISSLPTAFSLWFQNRSQCRGLPLLHRHPESVPMQQADMAVQRSSDIAWETNWPCLSRLRLQGFVCLIELRVQENYRGRTEGNKWKTSTGFLNTSLFHPQGNKTVTGGFVQGLHIKCLYRAPHDTAVHLLNIDTHQTDQSHQIQIRLHLMSSLG